MTDQILNQWQNNFFQVPNAIYDNRHLGAYEIAILLYLFRLANEGTAFPSITNIATTVQCSRPKVISTITELIAKKYILKTKRKKANGDQASNIYTLLDPKRVVNEINQSSQSGLPPLVNDINHPSKPDLLGVVNEVDCINTNITNTNLYIKIVGYLNTNADTKYRATTKRTQQLIKARLDEGFSEEDFQQVIIKKCREWKKDPQFAQYLRPETLFGAKFESYLNQKGGMRDVTASTASGNTRSCDSNQQLEGLF
ncbi:conserved phage C-terminal domain-containing protein [Listeria booriae]|uniref:conserved phage C-terminal domain-containing protein n=1 Tax=Listeria booriae TaxID=1552123 RepID=UPI001C8AB198|nr:conserved phage C-terminal domain-containing protein [Listeria booriae]